MTSKTGRPAKDTFQMSRGANRHLVGWQRLNEKQKMVAYLFATERTPAQVAQEMFLSPKHIDTICDSITQKLTLFSVTVEIKPFAAHAEPEIQAIVLPMHISEELVRKIDNLEPRESHALERLAAGQSLRQAIAADGATQKELLALLGKAAEKIGAKTLTQMVETVRAVKFPSLGASGQREEIALSR